MEAWDEREKMYFSMFGESAADCRRLLQQGAECIRRVWRENERAGDPIAFGAVAAALVPAFYEVPALGAVVGNYEFETWFAPATLPEPPALPDGCVAGPLGEQDVAAVDAAWTYRSPQSARVVAECIASRPSMGVWSPTGQLVAWGVCRADWTLGMLHVLPEMRQRGLASYIMLGLVAGVRAANPEAVPHVFIDKANEASKRLHVKAQFLHTDRFHHWVRLKQPHD